MDKEIEIKYSRLVKIHDDLNRLKSEQLEFETSYRKKSFLDKQFNMQLNTKRTQLKSEIDDLKTSIERLKRKLCQDIEHDFFYNNDDSRYSSLMVENNDMLKSAVFEVSHIGVDAFLKTKRYQRFSGGLNNNSEIILKAIEDKSDLVNVFFDDEFYIDFEGSILPNGIARFEGKNISDISMIDPPIIFGGKYAFNPGIFNMSISHEMKFCIKSDLKNGVVPRYNLKGFRIKLKSLNTSKFYSNAEWLNEGYKIFIEKYSLAFIN